MTSIFQIATLNPGLSSGRGRPRATAGPPFSADPHLAAADHADPGRCADPGALGHSRSNSAGEHPWRELRDEFGCEPEDFQERHYSEFVTFLPYVRRFLYGEGNGRGARPLGAESPLRVFRRNDIAKVRLTFPDGSPTPETFDVAHVDLYFLYDIDIVLLVVEIFADDLGSSARAGHDVPLRPRLSDLLGGGRARRPLRRPRRVARPRRRRAGGPITSSAKRTCASSASIARRASPPTGLICCEPLVPDYSDEKGLIRYRQIEYARMPLMAYLAMDDARALTRADFIRLGLVTGPGPSDVAALLGALHARLRGPLLLRPVLERRARRTSRNALHVVRARLRDGRRRRRSVLRGSRRRPARRSFAISTSCCS